MLPNPTYVTIQTSEALLESFINEVMLTPRLKVVQWSKITKQSPGLKIGYPAQHIASLLTGVEGSRTAARGDDLADGSEVKGCNRIDQLDSCKDCGNKVLRSEPFCSFCQSINILRKDDSKWLFTIKSEAELQLLTERIDRVLLILLDYPNFLSGDFESLSVKAYEIWPKYNATFRQLLSDYYYNIYLEHIRLNPKKTPAPKNFWPYSFQFFKCKPLKTYECLISDINTEPKIVTKVFVDPSLDRSTLAPENFPIELLDANEFEQIANTYRAELEQKYGQTINDWLHLSDKEKSKRTVRVALSNAIGNLDPKYLDCLELRDTSRAIPHATEYSRR